MMRRHWLGTTFAIMGMASLAASARAEDKNEDEDEPKFLASMPIAGTVSFDAKSHRECKPLLFRAGDKTTIFTERPTRQAHSMATGEFVQGWTEAYGAVGPNAHLYLFNKQGQSENAIVHLKAKPTWNDATKTITFPDACFIQVNEDRHDRKPHSQFDLGVLFIDAAAAKVFKWNSCYGDGSGGADDPNAADFSWGGCLEQWGSYPASCLKLKKPQYRPGMRCKQICNTKMCPGSACWSKYDSSSSVKLVASYYSCSDGQQH